MNMYAVIMAGGTGTRFWPLSKKTKPKQFLPIISEKTMIEETVHRLKAQIPLSHIFTVANQGHTQIIGELLPEIPRENLLIEPQGKNTAPSLVLATAKIFQKDPEAAVAALPADHLITEGSLFLKKLIAAGKAAVQSQKLITFGIRPSYPATGYGYIQFSRDNPSRFDNEDFFSVLKFKEKPQYNQAKAFVNAGTFFWNSGMFIWRADVFADKLKRHAASLYGYWEQMLEALENEDAAKISAIFDDIPSVSIDYGLMEKTHGVFMCEGNFGWSDVGAWSALSEIWPKDNANNAWKGGGIALDSQGCLIHNPSKLTALVGLKDLIVVETDDVLLICHKDQDQRIKEIVEDLKKKEKDEYL